MSTKRSSWQRGTLLGASEAPAGRERIEQLLAHRNLVVEQILSGHSDEPVTFVQDQDEWVVVLAGAARLDVGGEPVHLRPGDWLFLPAGMPHTVVRTEAATSWLAVHLHP